MSKWRIIKLDDGREWLTDGTHGIAPEAAPDLLAACEGMMLEAERLAENLSNPDWISINLRLNAIGAAIAKAKGGK
jgi:hypothetical protein